jgi:hypothetical protein
LTFSIDSAMMRRISGRWLVNMIFFEFSVKTRSVSTGHLKGGGGGGTPAEAPIDPALAITSKP